MKPTLRNKVASALSFAHLAGVSARAKVEDEDPDKKDPNAEDDEPEHEDQDRQDGNSRKAKRAEDDEPEKEDPDAEDDEPEKGDDPDAEDEDDDKKAKAETDEDDDDDSEMHGKSTAANARRRERARCAAIFGCKAAGRNPVLAATLAFNTTMSRKEAISVLQNTTAAYAPSASRGHRNPSLGGGGSAEPSSSQAGLSRMDAAMKRVRPR